MMGNKHLLGFKFTDESKAKISNSCKGKTAGDKHPFYGKPRSEEAIKKWVKSVNLKSNKAELKLFNILQTIDPNHWDFVGDGKIIIGNKISDFINVNGQKKLIELFGVYWHKSNEEQQRITHFKRFGFDTLVIWDYELKNFNVLKQKITKFFNFDYNKEDV